MSELGGKKVMSVMSTDLSMWDMNPKNGMLPLTCTVVGYLVMSGYANYGQNNPTPTPVDGQAVYLQIDYGGGDYHNTTLMMVTRYNPSTGIHGYFSGTAVIVAWGGNGIWVGSSGGINNFRVYYAGNSELAGCNSPQIAITTTTALTNTDLSMCDMTPKSGEGSFACTVVGYLMRSGITENQSDSSIVDGETMILEMQNSDGSWTDTGIHMITGYNSSTGYHGYYSGSVIIGTPVSTAPYGPGTSYMPWPQGTYNFRISYAGNSSKNLVGC